MTLSLRQSAAGVLFAFFGMFFAGPSVAIESLLRKALSTEDIGASERVEAAGLLRILSQEMANAACHLQYGVDIERSHKLLNETKQKFTYILDALEFGSENLNIIGPEKRRKTVVKIQELRDAWLPLRDAGIRLLEDASDVEALKLIKAENEAILAKTSILTSELASEYSNPVELIQVDVMLLDFAGRQAMLTQKMGKIACEIWAGNDSDDRIELLSKTMQTYDLTLMALLDGMPAAGIKAAPTPEIRAALEAAQASWRVVQSELLVLIDKHELTMDEKTQLYADLTDAMYEMEDIEKLYVRYSKH